MTTQEAKQLILDVGDKATFEKELEILEKRGIGHDEALAYLTEAQEEIDADIENEKDYQDELEERR